MLDIVSKMEYTKLKENDEMTRKDRDHLTLSSGREIYTNCGIIGISPVSGIFGGYDDSIWIEPEDEEDSNFWTQEEKKELAEEMIRLWKNFGDIPHA